MVFLEKSNIAPICPHCSAELSVIHFRGMTSTLGKRYIYFCPSCRKVLGITHRKGFWMG